MVFDESTLVYPPTSITSCQVLQCLFSSRGCVSKLSSDRGKSSTVLRECRYSVVTNKHDRTSFDVKRSLIGRCRICSCRAHVLRTFAPYRRSLSIFCAVLERASSGLGKNKTKKERPAGTRAFSALAENTMCMRARAGQQRAQRQLCPHPSPLLPHEKAGKSE